jgi:hypothetical protein
MEQQLTTVGVQVGAGPDATDDEVAEAAERLRRELLELDVETVDPVHGGEAPDGSRAVELLALGGLVVSIAHSVPLSAVVGAVRSWLGAAPRRSITLEIAGDRLELTGVSSSEQKRLTDEWLSRHAAG